MAYSGRWPLSNFGSLCKLRRTSLTKKKVEEAPNIKKEFAYSREASWACFSMRADPVFHRLSVHSSVCSVLRNTPLPFAFPPDILWADGLCRIFENEGGSTRLNSSSQFSTWLCSLWAQWLNTCLLYLLHWQMDSLPLCHLGMPLWNIWYI